VGASKGGGHSIMRGCSVKRGLLQICRAWMPLGAGVGLLMLGLNGLAAAVADPTEVALAPKEKVLKLAPGPDNPRNSEGSFVTLKSGRILFIFSRYTGDSASDHASAFLASRYSDDGGKTWSQADVEVVPQEGRMNVMSVSLLRLNDGRIALFYLRKNSEQDCIPMLRISGDEARTWSEPRPCITDQPGYYVLNNDRVVQLASGRLLVAVARHATPESPRLEQRAALFVYISDDAGASWHRSQEVPNPEGIITQEPGVVPLSGGRIGMFIRTDSGFQYGSISADAGENWTPIQPTSLHSPLAPASIERIPGTDKLVAVWNNNHALNALYRGKRTPLTIAVSDDDGRTWTRTQNIETADAWFCYTAIHWTEEHLLLGYCSGSLAQTDIVRIRLADLTGASGGQSPASSDR
jgi:sialidase-1